MSAQPADVAAMLRAFHELIAHPDTDALWTRRTLHDEEHVELVEALEEMRERESWLCSTCQREALEAVARELADVVYVAYGTAHALGIDLDAALLEVHRANMSKAGGPRRADGKALKPPGFRAPDMSAAVAAALERGAP